MRESSLFCCNDQGNANNDDTLYVEWFGGGGLQRKKPKDFIKFQIFGGGGLGTDHGHWKFLDQFRRPNSNFRFAMFGKNLDHFLVNPNHLSRSVRK